MNKIKYILLCNCWLIIGCLLSLLLILVWFASIGEDQIYVLFSSDALYLPSIYKDIFVDGNSVQGWTFNPAPNFIPDMFLFFLLMGMVSNFLTATFLFSIIQYFAIIAFFYFIFRKISDISTAVFSLSIYLFSFFLLYFLIDHDFYYSFLIMSNSYHNGMFVMTLICVLLSIHFLKKESWVTLFFILILSAIAYPCDKLFFVAYNCPLIFSLLVLLIAGYDKRKILKLGITCILGAILGMIILDKLKYNSIFDLTGHHQYINLEAMIASWKMFSSQMKIYLSLKSFTNLTVILSIITYIWTICYCILDFIKIKRSKKEISLLFVFQIFVLFFTPILLLAPIINGNYLGYDVIRYNYFVFIVLLFNLILLINNHIKKRKYLVVGLNCFFSAMLTAYLLWSIYNMDFGHQLNNYFSFYPEQARNFDSQFPTKNTVQYGITDDYWYAKHVTMFSKNNMRLYCTFSDATPYLHVSNKKWYYGGGNWKYSNPQFTFLVWSSDEKLPDFFIEQNTPYISYAIDKDRILYFVSPFSFNIETKQPELSN